MNYYYLLTTLAIVMITSIVHYKNLFNPLALFNASLILSLISLQIVSIYGIGRDVGQEYDGIFKAYWVGGTGFLIAWLLIKEKWIGGNIYDYSERLEVFLRNKILLLAITIVLLIMVCVGTLGYLPIYSMFRGNIVIADQAEMRNSLPFGILGILTIFRIIFSLLLASYLTLYHDRIKWTTAKIILLIVFIIFTSLWEGNRQLLLIYMFTYLARYYQNRKTRFMLKPLVFIIAFISLFFVVQYIRIGKEGATQYELILYFCYTLWNLESIIENYDPTYSPLYTLSEIIPSRLLNREARDIKDLLIEPTASSGYFTYWFLDYGFVGIFVGCVLLGLISKYLFTIRNNNEINMCMYILILYCCATVSFYSHVISLVFVPAPFLVLIYLNHQLKRHLLPAVLDRKLD